MDDATLILQKISTIVDAYEAKKKANASDFNIFSITGIHYKELPICSFLRELLDPQGSHMQGSLFLKTFIKQVLRQNIFADEDYDKAKVYKELHIDNKRRIDILISIAGRLFPIEVKIYAGDQDAQLIDYYIYTNTSDSKAIIYYLTLDKHEPSKTSKANLKKGIQYECISFESDVLSWLKQIVTMEQIRSIPRLYEVLSQFLDVILKLTDQIEERKIMEFNNLIKTSKDIHAVLELEKALIDIKCQMMKKVFSAIENRLAKRRPELSLAHRGYLDGYMDYYTKGRNTWPSLNYFLPEKENKPIGKQYVLRIEIETYLYFGICNWDDVNKTNPHGRENDSIKYVSDNSKLKGEVKATDAFYWWEHLTKDMQVNYRSPNKEYESLFDNDTFDIYINKICDKIEAFMDVWNETDN
jgi:hypothetical protein